MAKANLRHFKQIAVLKTDISLYTWKLNYRL